MLSQSGVLVFSTSIRRLTRKETSLVRNHEDRGLVSSIHQISSRHKLSLFVHHPRLTDTQSPHAVITRLCLAALTAWKAMLLSSQSPCGLTLKRAMCLFHGTLATLSESQLSGSPYWMRKCPSSLRFNFFLSVQPADWATPRRCIPPFDRRLPSPDDVLGANSSYRKPCLNRSSSARAASLRLIPGILDNYPRSKSCYLLLRASRSAVLMSDSGAPKG